MKPCEACQNIGFTDYLPRLLLPWAPYSGAVTWRQPCQNHAFKSHPALTHNREGLPDSPKPSTTSLTTRAKGRENSLVTRRRNPAVNSGVVGGYMQVFSYWCYCCNSLWDRHFPPIDFTRCCFLCQDGNNGLCANCIAKSQLPPSSM